MKIAIITFQRAHNYGSILQGYALQKYINDMPNTECEIIDFSNYAQKEMYRIFRKKKNIHNLIRNLITILAYFPIKREYVEFEKFIEDNLNLSKRRYQCYEDMLDLENEYDIFVAGSDQIWNIKCPDHDDVYFLNFIKNKKKVAYAPSFGAENIQNELPEKVNVYKNLFNQFSALSIREKNGQKWLYEMTGVTPRLLIDPTLFYDKRIWEQLMSPPMIKYHYILYYSFHFSQEINCAVKKISKKLKLPVLILNARAWVFAGCAAYGFHLSAHSGPADFLRVINDADLILSNSFHGTVFSVIFHKKFWFLFGAVQSEYDDRALTLVQQLGIEDRVLDVNKVDTCNLQREINYNSVDLKIQGLRKEAFEYLNNNLR